MKEMFQKSLFEEQRKALIRKDLRIKTLCDKLNNLIEFYSNLEKCSNGISNYVLNQPENSYFSTKDQTFTINIRQQMIIMKNILEKIDREKEDDQE